MRVTKLIMILLIIILSIGCERKTETIQEPEEKIQLCVPPTSSGIMHKYIGFEYLTPVFLYPCLDSVIMQGKNSLCYREGYSGFVVIFGVIENGIGHISITTKDMMFIGDYSDYMGFFEYKSHYFACYGEVDMYPIDIVRQVEANIAFPNMYLSEIIDSERHWSYRYENGDLSFDTESQPLQTSL